MKNIIKTIAFAALVTGLVAPVLSFGQAPAGPTGVPTDYQSFLRIVTRLLDFAFAILVIIAVFLMLWAAYQYMTNKPEDAKKQIVNAAIALAIGLLAKGLPYLVNAIVGTTYTPPTL